MSELSVIMPVYNEKIDWVKQSVESILNQTFDDFEFIIIIDNPDNIQLKKLLLEYSRKDKRIRLIENEENIGLVKSLNKGLSVSNGKYIARMDADDISLPERFNRQLNFLKENKNVKLVGVNWRCIDESSNILFEHGKLPTKYSFIKKNIKYNNMFLHPSWMFDSDILRKVNGYREVTFCEDYDFITRLLTENISITNINEFLILYRVRNSSISISKAYEQYINSIRVIKFMKQRINNSIDNFKEDVEILYKEEEKRKFIDATKNFIESRACLKNRDVIGFLRNFILSFFTSRQRARKNINIIIFNIKCKILRPF